MQAPRRLSILSASRDEATLVAAGWLMGGAHRTVTESSRGP